MPENPTKNKLKVPKKIKGKKEKRSAEVKRKYSWHVPVSNGFFSS